MLTEKGLISTMIHLLDPRTKLITAFFFTILVVASRRLSWLLPEWGALVAFVIIIGKGTAYLRWLRLSLPMALFFGAVTWWTADLKTGLMAALALLNLISIFFVFFSTTTPEDLGNSLVKIGLPYPVAFVFSTSLQFVPMIGRKARNVLDAQRSRGIPAGTGLVRPAALSRLPGAAADSGLSAGGGTGGRHGDPRFRPPRPDLLQGLSHGTGRLADDRCFAAAASRLPYFAAGYDLKEMEMETSPSIFK